ncbi:hypothetical protein DFH28DRAFT_1077773 [Melampsora americana]|nr:hypothetical protein DFH28DRAFT_1077773 [Melampsora americana]
MVEERTVTTQVNFPCLAELWNSEAHSKIIGINLPDKHYLHNSHRDPPEHRYESKCPHEFSLHRRTMASDPAPIEQSLAAEGNGPDRLVLHLSDSVRTMYTGWRMKWSRTADHQPGDPVEWKTIAAGETMVMKQLLEGPGTNGKLYFRATWSCRDTASLLHSTQRELDNLTRAVAQMRTAVIDTCNRPSIDVTRLVFRSKRSGSMKNLYTGYLTSALRGYPGHSPEYSETQVADEAPLGLHEPGNLGEGIGCGDSDEEWDSEPEAFEPPKVPHEILNQLVYDNRMLPSKRPFMSQTPRYSFQYFSRRTYQAFIDYAICGALYFAPLRSKYQEYCKTHSVKAPEIGQSSDDKHFTPWPEWAEAHYTPHTVIAGFKTLSSPKSLYRLADSICHKQIIASLEVNNLTAEIQSPVFDHYTELRVDAYKLVRKNWKSLTSSDRISLITHLAQDEAALVDQYILMNISL